ncbi:MAG: glutaredoxin 3 [Sulfuricaulis sp.]|nr:glutaredoxin 3 [Sulfuricaulis sp.]MCR4346768.1 glutaredoxin 3 [Sulfuricaulis sp.]
MLIYGSRLCPYCRMAERLLEKKGIQAEKVMVDENSARRDEMTRRAGRTSVPQIFIGETYVGGYAELAVLERTGQLDAMLNSCERNIRDE